MSRCARIRQHIVDDLYDELDGPERQEVEEHCWDCPACAVVLEQMRATVELLRRRRRPEPSEEFWEGYWGKLTERIHGDRVAHPQRRMWETLVDRVKIKYVPVRKVAWAFVMLLIGIGIGRFFFSGRETEMSVTRSATVLRTPPEQVDDMVDRYLSRSTLLLLRVVNQDFPAMSAAKVNVSREKRMSKELLQTAALLREQLSAEKRQEVKALINGMEPILLKIANMAEEENIEQMELLWESVDRSLLVKINIYTMKRSSAKQSS